MTPIDLFRPFVAEEAKEAVARVLTPDANGRVYLGQGPETDAFEIELQAFLKCAQPPLTVNSGTSAITLALALLEVEEGDVVISTPMSCAATNLPLLHTGAHIAWADVHPHTGLIDPGSVADLVASIPPKKLAAIVAVDWGGHRCDYDALRAFGVPVIQDAAHNLTNALPGGDYTCWSFQAIKHLTTGDGGAILTPPEEYERAKLMRWYGLDRTKGESFRCAQDILWHNAGFKFHLNDIAAAIGRANLPFLRYAINAQRANAKFLLEQIETPAVKLPCGERDCPYWLVTLLVEERDAFIAHLAAQGIAASPVHRRNDDLSCFIGFRRSLPGVDYFAARNVAIPCGWWLTVEDLERIVEAVNTWK